MYRCNLCGTVFSRPDRRRWREPMPDGFREPCSQPLCPACGAEEPYFDETPEGDEEPWENPLKGLARPPA